MSVVPLFVFLYVQAWRFFDCFDGAFEVRHRDGIGKDDFFFWFWLEFALRLVVVTYIHALELEEQLSQRFHSCFFADQTNVRT